MKAELTTHNSVAELLAAAARLSEDFGTRVAQSERERKVPPQNIEQLREAGLFRVFQPARFGTPELSMAEVLPIIAVIAEGCPSTAWALAVHQIEQWIVGLFPDQAQDLIFADNPNALCSGVLQPRGKVTREPGGYRIMEGRWPFASGCDYSDWIDFGGLVTDEQGPPEQRGFLVNKRDFEIVDDWHVTGLRGTGSKSITVKDVFVPAEHSISIADAISGKAGVGKSTLFHAGFLPMLSLNVTGPAVGAARTAIAAFKAHTQTRNMPFSQMLQADASLTHRQLGQALMKLDVAELVLERSARLVNEFAVREEVMPIEERAKVRVDSAYAVRQCLELVNELCQVSGGGILQETHPLQRLQRDLNAMGAHAALNLDFNFELLGASTLNKPLSSAFV